MSARTWPKVEALPMEPGAREWMVVADNAHTPVHTWRTYAEKLTESEARYIAAACNLLGLLRRMSDRIPSPDTTIGLAIHEALIDAEDAG